MYSANDNCSHSLIEKARAGSQPALGSLLDFYRPYLLKLANESVDSDLRPKLAPSDVVQSTLVVATESFPDFQGTTDDTFRQWILTIFNNHLVDGIRRFRSQKRAYHREIRPVHEPVASESDSPSQLFSAREQVTLLLQCVETLDAESREIFRLRYVDGLPFEIIGSTLNLSHDAARRRWLKAVQRLSHLMHVGDADDE